MRVTGINALTPSAGQRIQQPQRGAGDFMGLLGKLVDRTNDTQLKAEAAVKDLAAGKIENVHDVMLAEVEADLSFKMLLQTRNKLVEAYKEVMRMQI